MNKPHPKGTAFLRTEILLLPLVMWIESDPVDSSLRFQRNRRKTIFVNRDRHRARDLEEKVSSLNKSPE